MDLLFPAIVAGMVYGLASLGLALSYRYLGFPDFTVLGSIVLGGVVCIAASRLGGPVVGVMSGTLSGCFLGLVTGALHVGPRIPAPLAGIVTFIGSLTPSYMLTTGGEVALPPDLIGSERFLLSARADLLDIVILSLCIFAVALSIAAFVQTKAGSLLLAMEADPRFLSFRHRTRAYTFITTLAVANGLVGCAGAFGALVGRSASVPSHADFLPFALGGVFAGAAVVSVARKWARRNQSEPSGGRTTSSQRDKVLAALSAGTATELHGFFPTLWLFLSFAAGTTLFVVISSAVKNNLVSRIPYLSWLTIPSNLHHLSYVIIAVLVVGSFWWAGPEDG